MMHRKTLLKSAATAAMLALLPASLAQADEPVSVVATFSILGDMVERIGGDHIALTTLVGRDGDAHVFQPTPADAKAVSGAEILFVNGLEFEGWLERLAEASSFDGEYVVATAGIEPIPFEEDGHLDGHGDHADGHDDHGHDDHGHDEHAHEEHGHDDHGHDEHAHEEHGHDDHGHDEHAHEEHGHDEHGHDEHAHEEHGHDDHGHDEHAKDEHAHEDHADGHHGHDHGAFDPHAWQSLKLAVTYVDNITAALAKADPANAAVFYENRAAYIAEIEALDAEIGRMMAALPESKRTVVTSHDAFQYFGRDYGLVFKAPQGLSTESEASAKDVARLIGQMREQGISAVFLENIADSRLLEQIASETGASIGGTLYPGALSGLDGPAPTYLDMMRYNAETLAGALGS